MRRGFPRCDRPMQALAEEALGMTSAAAAATRARAGNGRPPPRGTQLSYASSPVPLVAPFSVNTRTIAKTSWNAYVMTLSWTVSICLNLMTMLHIVDVRDDDAVVKWATGLEGDDGTDSSNVIVFVEVGGADMTTGWDNTLAW